MNDPNLALILANMSRDELSAALAESTERFRRAQELASLVLNVPFGAYYRFHMHDNPVDGKRVKLWEARRKELLEILRVEDTQ